MTAKLIVIGLDSAEIGMLATGAASGTFQTLARLYEDGTYHPLTSSDAHLGAVWSEIAIGISLEQSGIFYPRRQFHTGEARARSIDRHRLPPSRLFWNVAAGTGRRVAAIDPPMVLPPDEGPATQLLFWGTHERPHPPVSYPTTLAPELMASFGTYPLLRCDDTNDGTVAGRSRLASTLRAGIAAKRELALSMLVSQNWDLFFVSFSEAHCGGHHLWDPPLPDARRSEPHRAGDPLAAVYSNLDRAMGALIEAAGPDAHVVVFTSHGMDGYHRGAELMPTLVERLELAPSRRRRQLVRARLPVRVKQKLRKLVPDTMLQRLDLTYDRALAGDATLAAAPISMEVGAIRLNLAGREPHGTVNPGAEADALVAMIRSELGSLRVCGSGEPAVAAVRTAAEEFGADHHPDLPDLIVHFRQDVGSLLAVESESLGVVRIRHGSHRTGEHRGRGGMWVLGVRGRGVGGTSGRLVDVAPTILELAGVARPPSMEGTSLVGA